jgi:CRP-like cAMP-binding protein
MLSTEDIKFYLTLFKDLSISDLVELFGMAQTRKIPAGEIYIDEGSTYKKLALIRKGLIRVYCIKPNGDDVTLMLRWEKQFFASHDNIILNQPSRFIYEALENTVLTEVDYNRVENILNNNPRLSSYRNLFLLNMLAESIERMESFVLLSPEERYLQLVKNNPDIVNRVHNKYLATLLGITPVSLSRIRHRIAKTPQR